MDKLKYLEFYMALMTLISGISTIPLQPEPPTMAFPQPASQTKMQAIIRQRLQNLLQEKSLFNPGQNNIPSQQGDAKQRAKSMINLENTLQNVIRNKQIQQIQPVSMTSSKVRPQIVQETGQKSTMFGTGNVNPPNNGTVPGDVTGKQLENYPQSPEVRAQSKSGTRDQSRNQLEQQDPLRSSRSRVQRVQTPQQKQPSLNDQILEVLRIVTLIRQQQEMQNRARQNSFMSYCGSLENLLMCGLDMSFCCFDMF